MNLRGCDGGSDPMGGLSHARTKKSDETRRCGCRSRHPWSATNAPSRHRRRPGHRPVHSEFCCPFTASSPFLSAEPVLVARGQPAQGGQWLRGHLKTADVRHPRLARAGMPHVRAENVSILRLRQHCDRAIEVASLATEPHDDRLAKRPACDHLSATYSCRERRYGAATQAELRSGPPGTPGG